MNHKEHRPPQLGAGKAKKVKVLKESSPFSAKMLLYITQAGEIYKENGKIYMKLHGAQYPKLLAQLVKHEGKNTLYIKDRTLDGRYFNFNTYLIENTKCENVLFESEKEFFLIPVDRIMRSGIYSRTFITKTKPIDLQYKFPYTLLRMYHLKDYPKHS